MNISGINSTMPMNGQSVAPDTGPGQEEINLFKELMTGAPTRNSAALLPETMLDKQLDYMKLTVGVDYLARVSGSASQAINKLVSLT
ncbi:EscI/YscI/HrpB family type III secretion system inner rod protein [Salmonella enterica subsp. salamae]|nr:EscI/YscI/HrpB family type III secretion system inner rod protein [Salmonella enterica subsp. salamae]ECJ2280075.1 EscI/YscI/HrpB family type III secretion system inner rod protein [Salmonella enterica subsp. salamae]HCC0886918.1 type III secretion system inner rod subunit SctI [Salmonella enterica]